MEPNAANLPWYLIGLLVTATLAVFYAMLKGKIMSSEVVDRLIKSAENRAEAAEAGAVANTKVLTEVADQVGKLMVMAENTDKVMTALKDGVGRRDSRESRDRRGS